MYVFKKSQALYSRNHNKYKFKDIDYDLQKSHIVVLQQSKLTAATVLSDYSNSVARFINFLCLSLGDTLGKFLETLKTWLPSIPN